MTATFNGGVTYSGGGFTFTPPIADPYFEYNTLLLPGNGANNANNNTFTDSSTNNLAITRVGNTTQGTFTPFGGNWSSYFDGTGDYLTIADNSNLEIGAVDFTIEAWFNITSLPASGILADVVSKGATNIYQPYSIAINSSGSCVYYSSSNGTSWNISNAQSFGAISTGTWYHVAVSREGTNTRLFLNGALITTIANSSGALYNNTNAFGVGGRSDGTETFTGFISNVRLVNGTAVYTSAFTPSTTPLTVIANTQVLTCQSNRFIDTSANGFTVTMNGNTNIQRFSPFNPSSVTPTSYSGYFNGSTDYLTPSSSVATNITTGAFTVEFWINQLTVSTKYVFGSASATAGRLTGRVSSTTVAVIDTNGTNSFTVPTFLANTWYHIAIVRDASSNTTVFVNGTRSSTGTISITTSYTDLQRIGAYLTNYFSGYVSNFRVVVGTAVYDPTQTTITVPTSPLTAVSGTSLLTCQSTTFIDNSTNNFTITVNGDTIPTIQNPFGNTNSFTGYNKPVTGGSGYFDGSGDYLTVAPTTQTYLSTNSFTMEAWIYPTATNSLIAGRRSAVAARGFLFGFNATNNMRFWAGDTDVNAWNVQITSSAAYALNQWYHVAATRNASNVFTLWINGISVGTATASFAIADDTSTLQIGTIDSGSSPCSGYMTDFRLVIGTAVYTKNFIPNPAPLTAITNTSLLCNYTNTAIIDNAMMNDIETVSGALVSTTQSKFGGSSIFFNGTSDYITSASSSSQNLGGDFTIEGWFYFSALSTNRMMIDRWSTGVGGGWQLYWRATGTSIAFFETTAGVIVQDPTTTTIATGQWYHIAVTRSGSTVRLFIGGSQKASATFTTALTSTLPLSLGAQRSTSTNFFSGYMDDIRITNGYARYTTTFTPPTESFPLQ